jgi:hypothetical protein
MHHRYSKFRAAVEKEYPNALQKPLGEFLISLKHADNDFYRQFLNKYGDDVYSIFKIIDKSILDKKGIYAYTNAGSLKYIGRCRDSMRNRINQGYGKIHPKNCYLDGQATNCHLNALITQSKEKIQLWFCKLATEQIETAERVLISELDPPWNIQRG